jgi:hypothetical protein
MSSMPGGPPEPSMRAGDADRDRVLAELSQHFQAGRLTVDELDERNGRALTAKTMGDLASLLTDLPPLHPAPAPGPAPYGPMPAATRPARQPAAVIGPAIVVLGVLALATSLFTHGTNHFFGFGPFLIILIIIRVFISGGRRRGRWF